MPSPAVLSTPSHARLYLVESWIAFAAGGALILLAFALPVSMMEKSSFARRLVKVLGAVVVLCAVALLAIQVFVKA